MKNTTRILLFMVAFYIVIAVLAFLLLGGNLTVFSRDSSSLGATTATLTQTVVGGADEAQEQPAALIVPEPDPEPVVTEPEPAPVSDASAAASTEEPAADAAQPEEGLRYFTFKTSTVTQDLRLRRTPSLNGVIINKLKAGTPGYVLQPGNSWCHVVLETGETGYCATEYLSLTETTVDAYPEEIRSLVEPPAETLLPEFGQPDAFISVED